MNDYASNSSVQVTHNLAEHRYEIRADGQLAVAEYSDQGNVRTMTHTFVPPELRGQGLAERLVRQALVDAKAQKLKIIPACSYVASFLKRQREYVDLVAN